MNNPRLTAKERGLLKGSVRRVFSRSELRKAALELTRIEHYDPNRPRVTRWSWCTSCGLIEPSYLIEVDHVEPLVPIDRSFEEMSFDELVDRTWCELENLKPVCKPCHREKSSLENKERRRSKKERK